MNTLIKGGTIVSDIQTYKADILIKDGKISEIGSNLDYDSSEETMIIDAEGKYVLPGAIDVHTHFDLKTKTADAVDDFYTGTVAAVCGGTTTIIDHLAFGPDNCSLSHQIDEYHKLANGNAVIDYSFHGVIQHVNDSILSEIREVINDGITSFKVYLTYDYKLNEADILKVLQKMKELGGVTTFHAENDAVINELREKFLREGKTAPIYHAKSRPDDCEAEAIGRLIKIAEQAGSPPIYIVHLSSKKGLEKVLRERESGKRNLFLETCTQYLTLTDEEYEAANHEGLKYILSPPLRKKKDCDALWNGIATDDIQVVATDHCPYRFHHEKQLGKDNFALCPNGIPGVEERLRIVFSEGVMKNRITINKLVETLSTNPAKIFGLYPKKGAILPGSDGDIVIIDPSVKEVITESKMHSRADYTVYEGMEVQGKIDMVIRNGEVVVKDNKFLGKRGQGSFLKRNVTDLNIDM